MTSTVLAMVGVMGSKPGAVPAQVELTIWWKRQTVSEYMTNTHFITYCAQGSDRTGWRAGLSRKIPCEGGEKALLRRVEIHGLRMSWPGKGA